MKWVKKIENFKVNLPIPVIGVGCGVLGMSLSKQSIHLGKYASTLLRALEYRGYDSTGACFQKDNKEITLLKDVGAPSKLVKTLGIENEEGRIFCGQVRWATFGQVDQQNAQPHIVRCKRHIFGAHNGNITNTRELKTFLLNEGHSVVSDNDGEMLVHTIEHYFNIELNRYNDEQQNDVETRRKAMKNAIVIAAEKVIGSYAAVIVDPITEYSYAIKAGSSLYFGVGEKDGNKFTLTSSDLTAVLRFTKNLLNLKEGDCVEFKDDKFKMFAFKDYSIKKLGQPTISFKAGDNIDREASRSRLRAEDTELLPDYDYFMDQEISAQPESTGKLAKLFQGGSNTGKRIIRLLEQENICKKVREISEGIRHCNSYKKQLEFFNKFADSKEAESLFQKIKKSYPLIYKVLITENFEQKYFFSSDMNVFIDLMGKDFDEKRILIAKVFDSITEIEDFKEFEKTVKGFLKIVQKSRKANRKIYTLACGTSFHATKVAALFFNEISELSVLPVLPGDFRGQYSRTLQDDDVVIGVSQSGETKDLIDIFDDIDRSGLKINKVVLVNNMNSTLGQEKSDVSIPILCGPEIAVPATKSFLNQLMLFYYLAIRVAEEHHKNDKTDRMNYKLAYRRSSLNEIPRLIRETIETTDSAIEEVASKIYLEPSMHILATKISGVAKEGALKVRETVLNHTEGGEASEFKHGPNTILGRNTVFGMKHIKQMMSYFTSKMESIREKAVNSDLCEGEIQHIYEGLSEYMFSKRIPFNFSAKAKKIFLEIVEEFDVAKRLDRNYPLIYVTGPEERDVNLTISQINTHKIRGADTFVIAEENDRLKLNARLNPKKDAYYGFGYITLPKTDDSLLTVFSSSVVLQKLALKMSEKKMNYLDKMGIQDHGVHPDVPKNVSKSITVD